MTEFHDRRTDWMPTEGGSPEHDEPFELSPEKAAYYDALEASDAHQDKMAGMGVAERNMYMRGLREGLNGPNPKAGDLDNPLKKDMPKEPAPRQPRQPKPPNPMAQAKKMRSLANKARGRRR